jgi:hypothetical protein
MIIGQDTTSGISDMGAHPLTPTTSFPPHRMYTMCSAKHIPAVTGVKSPGVE